MPRRKGNATRHSFEESTSRTSTTRPVGESPTRDVAETGDNVEETTRTTNTAELTALQVQLEIMRCQMAEKEKEREFQRIENEREHRRRLELLEKEREIAAEADARSQRDRTLAPGCVNRRPNGNDAVEEEERIMRWQKLLKGLVPNCEPRNNDLVQFFKIVEGLYQAYQIPERYRATLVVPLLGPRASPLIINLSPEELRDYNKIKQVVLAENLITPAEQRRRFVTAKREQDETFVQFASRLKTLFRYYLESKNVHTEEEMVQLMIADQFLDTLAPEMRVYVELQAGTTNRSAEDLALIAETYREVQRHVRPGSTKRDRNHEMVDLHSPKLWRKSIESGRTSPRRSSWKSDGPRRLQCYGCRIYDHLVRDCPLKPRERTQSQHTVFAQAKYVEVEKAFPEERNSGGKDERVVARVTALLSKEMDAAVARTCHQLEMDSDLPTQGSAQKQATGRPALQHVEIRVNDGEVLSGIVDSGCEITVINAKHVDPTVVQRKGKIKLRPAFGPECEAQLVEVPMSLHDSSSGKRHPEVRVLAATIPHLNGQILISPGDYRMLAQQAEQYLDYSPKCLPETKVGCANANEGEDVLDNPDSNEGCNPRDERCRDGSDERSCPYASDQSIREIGSCTDARRKCKGSTHEGLMNQGGSTMDKFNKRNCADKCEEDEFRVDDDSGVPAPTRCNKSHHCNDDSIDGPSDEDEAGCTPGCRAIESCLGNGSCDDHCDDQIDSPDGARRGDREGNSCKLTTEPWTTIIGSFYCIPRSGNMCPPDFKTSDASDICKKVDECDRNLHNCDSEEEQCRNGTRSYECLTARETSRRCSFGFSLNEESQQGAKDHKRQRNIGPCSGECEVCVNDHLLTNRLARMQYPSGVKAVLNGRIRIHGCSVTQQGTNDPGGGHCGEREYPECPRRCKTDPSQKPCVVSTNVAEFSVGVGSTITELTALGTVSSDWAGGVGITKASQLFSGQVWPLTWCRQCAE